MHGVCIPVYEILLVIVALQSPLIYGMLSYCMLSTVSHGEGKEKEIMVLVFVFGQLIKVDGCRKAITHGAIGFVRREIDADGSMQPGCSYF